MQMVSSDFHKRTHTHGNIDTRMHNCITTDRLVTESQFIYIHIHGLCDLVRLCVCVCVCCIGS